MTNPPNRPKPANQSNYVQSQQNSSNINSSANNRKSVNSNQDIVKNIKDAINSDNYVSLKDYPIKELIKHAEEFGSYLKSNKLETNQIRKFLDAINQLKLRLAQDDDDKIKQAKTEEEKKQLRFDRVGDELVFLKVKLIWSAAKQEAAKPFKEVMSAAIDKVHTKEDFERLVQLIESIIAYHKAEGGK